MAADLQTQSGGTAALDPPLGFFPSTAMSSMCSNCLQSHAEVGIRKKAPRQFPSGKKRN
jgi:hypothetical protein